MASLTLKQGDTYPPIQATLTDSNGAINLTTATGVIIRAKGNQSGTIITGACSIVNAATGVVQYSWGALDTAVVDTYAVEFVITWSGGGIQTVPNAAASNQTVQIDAEL